eukprot:scaffold1201_cov199-Alexandrium_tamarense.AAC.5
MSSVKAVRQLKEDLLKLQARPDGDGNSEKILDILQRLDKEKIDLAILTETLIGASVSKLKAHSDTNISISARGLVKKWKNIAKGKPADASKSTASTNNTSSTITDVSPSPNKLKRLDSAGSSDINPETEWQGLPQLRINICKKLHTIFRMSQSDLSKELNESAVKQLCLSRAGEVEAAVDTWSRGVKQTYNEKVRTLVFNLKKNGPLRDRVILGQVTPERLVKMTSEELQTDEKAKAIEDTVKSLQESRRLDWDQANEDKINDMCGIKGDLKNASLFTCGRCKSTKTTSTQKQTRSADEPMTVFVLCLNCGKRWKC